MTNNIRTVTILDKDGNNDILCTLSTNAPINVIQGCLVETHNTEDYTLDTLIDLLKTEGYIANRTIAERYYL